MPARQRLRPLSAEGICARTTGNRTSALTERLTQGHIVIAGARPPERLQSIQRMVADQMGDKLPDFQADALRAIPRAGRAGSTHLRTSGTSSPA